jgi:hypothetical protein
MRLVVLAVVALLALPASAHASFDVSSFTVVPSGTAAGSHPDVSISLGFSGDEHVRDLTVSLPPGLIGNPNATARCATASFQADGCAANTRVGSTAVQSTLLGLPVTADGDVYNLRPGTGEPARLGVVVRPPLGADKVFLITRVALRTADGGLDSIITGIPSTVRILGIAQEMTIRSMNLTLLGRPAGAAQPFMTLPTGCSPATARAVAKSADGTSVTRAAPAFTPTGCANLRFRPRFAATISAGHLPSLSTVITGADGDANAASAAVTLPDGIGVNLEAASHTCTIAQQAAGPCPPASHIGRAIAQSPLLPTLSGPVSLAAIPGQIFPGIRVDLSGVVALSLPGVTTFTPGLRTTFAGLPDVPLRRFALTFDADGALSTTRDVCTGKLPRMTADLTGHNGAKVHLDTPVIVTGCRKPVARLRVHGRKLVLRVQAARNGPALRQVRRTLPKRLKAHPRHGRVSPGAKLSRRGVLTVKANGARRITATLRHGAFTGRLGRKRTFVLRTVDVTGHPERQRIRARR